MAEEVVPDDNVNLFEDYPPEILEHLKLVDSWSFDVFSFTKATGNKPLKYLTRYLFTRYGFIQKFSIEPKVLKKFITKIEYGYNRFNNSFHTSRHAADVTQTLNAILRHNTIYTWFTDLEIFAALFAAIVHDYEHLGATNRFNVMTKSERALIYNDRSVNENHHLSAAFGVLQEYNILEGLSHQQYRQFRSLVIDLILSTDMEFHFQILNEINTNINIPDNILDKSKILSFILHACNMSHPAKKWLLHSQWTGLLMEEYFTQGDYEKQLKLPISPLCNRTSTSIPESQINFIDFIVDPTYKAFDLVLDYISKKVYENHKEGQTKPWETYIAENKRKWLKQRPYFRTMITPKRQTI